MSGGSCEILIWHKSGNKRIWWDQRMEWWTCLTTSWQTSLQTSTLSLLPNLSSHISVASYSLVCRMVLRHDNFTCLHSKIWFISSFSTFSLTSFYRHRLAAVAETELVVSPTLLLSLLLLLLLLMVVFVVVVLVAAVLAAAVAVFQFVSSVRSCWWRTCREMLLKMTPISGSLTG